MLALAGEATEHPFIKNIQFIVSKKAYYYFIPNGLSSLLLVWREYLMKKAMLVTGSMDGIGLETARMLVSQGHHVLLHGRNPVKLEEAEKTLSVLPDSISITTQVSSHRPIQMH